MQNTVNKEKRKNRHNWSVPLHVTHVVKAILTLRHVCINAYRFYFVLLLRNPLNAVKK